MKSMSMEGAFGWKACKIQYKVQSEQATMKERISQKLMKFEMSVV